MRAWLKPVRSMAFGLDRPSVTVETERALLAGSVTLDSQPGLSRSRFELRGAPGMSYLKFVCTARPLQHSQSVVIGAATNFRCQQGLRLKTYRLPSPTTGAAEQVSTGTSQLITSSWHRSDTRPNPLRHSGRVRGSRHRGVCRPTQSARCSTATATSNMRLRQCRQLQRFRPAQPRQPDVRPRREVRPRP